MQGRQRVVGRPVGEKLSRPFCGWKAHWDAHYYALCVLPAS